MTDKEKENYNITMDKTTREDIIKQVLGVAFGRNPITLEGINDIKVFYQNNYKRYLSVGRSICASAKPYQYGDFWLNDAGFQFMWKNHSGHIQLECIAWNEVKKRINNIN